MNRDLTYLLWECRNAVIVRHVLFGCGVVVLLAFVFLFLAARTTPRFYRELLEVQPTAETTKQGAELSKRFRLLYKEIQQPDKRWSGRLHQTEVNAWLMTELPGQYASSLPSGIEEPRLRIENEEIELAFSVQRAGLQGVASIRLEIELIEPNHLRLHLKRSALGMLPLPHEQVLPLIRQIIGGRPGLRVEEQTDKNGTGDSLDIYLQAPPKKGFTVQIEQFSIEGDTIMFSGETRKAKQ